METKSGNPTAKKILIVDDNRLILKALSMTLSAKGYDVLLAENGADAITSLRHDKPNLILLDLDFPPDAANIGGALTDGFLIIDWARRMCDAEKIPVIIISSTDPEKYKTRAEASGILTFFQKPLNKEDLLPAIERKIRENES
jgi:two-component system sensor histidine kinase ChiS